MFQKRNFTGLVLAFKNDVFEGGRKDKKQAFLKCLAISEACKIDTLFVIKEWPGLAKANNFFALIYYSSSFDFSFEFSPY